MKLNLHATEVDGINAGPQHVLFSHTTRA